MEFCDNQLTPCKSPSFKDLTTAKGDMKFPLSQRPYPDPEELTSPSLFQSIQDPY